MKIYKIIVHQLRKSKIPEPDYIFNLKSIFEYENSFFEKKFFV